MIVVAATLKAAEGKGDEIEQEFQKIVPKIVNDPGTLAYVVHRSIKNQSKFFIYEKYVSKEALKDHSSTPHFQEFFQTIGAALDGPPEMEIYHEIA